MLAKLQIAVRSGREVGSQQWSLGFSATGRKQSRPEGKSSVIHAGRTLEEFVV